MSLFIYASSDKDAVFAQAFEEHRDNLRNSQRVFLIGLRKKASPAKVVLWQSRLFMM